MSEKDNSGRISFQVEAGASVILYQHSAFNVGGRVVKDGKARVEFVGMSSSSLCKEPGSSAAPSISAQVYYLFSIVFNCYAVEDMLAIYDGR